MCVCVEGVINICFLLCVAVCLLFLFVCLGGEEFRQHIILTLKNKKKKKITKKKKKEMGGGDSQKSALLDFSSCSLEREGEEGERADTTDVL